MSSDEGEIGFVPILQPETELWVLFGYYHLEIFQILYLSLQLSPLFLFEIKSRLKQVSSTSMLHCLKDNESGEREQKELNNVLSFFVCKWILTFQERKKNSDNYWYFHVKITYKEWDEYFKLFFNRLIGLVGGVFARGPRDLGSIPGRVIPKTLKMVLDTSLLNTQHYKVRIKGKVEQSRERSSALLYTLV